MTRHRLGFAHRDTGPNYREAGVRVGDLAAFVTAWADGRVEVSIRDDESASRRTLDLTYYPAHHPRGNRDPSRGLAMFTQASPTIDIEEPNA